MLFSNPKRAPRHLWRVFARSTFSVGGYFRDPVVFDHAVQPPPDSVVGMLRGIVATRQQSPGASGIGAGLAPGPCSGQMVDRVMERGQAAVTDALYFILIVTFLSIFLFGFANTYGKNVKEQINNEFNTAFATNSLKAILYASTPRDPSRSLAEKDAEIDYLLAIIKEDYADDSQINDVERKVMGKTISSILSPLEGSIDYAFYITVPSEKKFVFFYLHLTQFKKQPYSITFKKLSGGEQGRYYAYTAQEDDASTQKDESHRNYFCAADKDADYDELTKKLSRLLTNVGPTSQASSSIKLVNETISGTSENFRAQADLVLWDAMWLGKTDERSAELFPYDVPASWQCVEAGVEENKSKT